MELNYIRAGDYFVPDLTIPEAPVVGKYGRLFLRSLRERSETQYVWLFLSGRLTPLAEALDREAGERMEFLVGKMAAAQGVTEALKAADQMAWVGAMNSIRAAAEEIVLREIVYA